MVNKTVLDGHAGRGLGSIGHTVQNLSFLSHLGNEVIDTTFLYK